MYRFLRFYWNYTGTDDCVKIRKKTVHVKLSKSCTVFSGKTDANDQSMQMKISLQINRPPLLLIIQDTVA
jgi:hypothetical protein